MATQSKQFEKQFQSNWLETLGGFCYRLYDVMSGYNGVAGISDFICYKYPFIFIIDCKSHQGNTVSFNDFSQYERMLPYKDVKGLVAGTVIWFKDHDRVVWVPIQTWEKIKNEGKKSFNIKMVGSDYECFDITSKKKRVYMDTDYKELYNYYEEKYGRDN